LNAPAKADGPIELLIREHSLTVEADTAGLQVMDVKERCANRSITLSNDAGRSITLTVDSDTPLPSDTRFALRPQPGSLFAFTKTA